MSKHAQKTPQSRAKTRNRFTPKTTITANVAGYTLNASTHTQLEGKLEDLAHEAKTLGDCVNAEHFSQAAEHARRQAAENARQGTLA